MGPRGRYLSLLASLCLIDLGMNGVYIVISKDWNAIAPVVTLNLIFLGLINVLGGLILSRPQALQAPSREGFQHRLTGYLDRLPARSSLWVFALSMIYCAVLFTSGAFTPPTDVIASIPVAKRAAALIWFAFVYAVYYSFYTFFVISDFCADVRRGHEAPPFGNESNAGPHPRVSEPRRGRFRRRIAWVFLVLAVVPSLHLIADLTWFADLRHLQGLSTTQTVILDLVATLLVLCIALVFVARSLGGPLEELTSAAESVGSGKLDVRVPLTTDDDFGVLTQAFNRMVEGLRERAFIRETFGKYVPESVAEAIVAGNAPIGPQITRATILFSDIEGFTGLAEDMSPEQVVSMLNAYFSAVLEPIERCAGVVNQFQGDAILVTFNVPVEDPQHAHHALQAALAILEATSNQTFSGVRLRARVGVNTGMVIAGNVGSGDRYNYTVHGSPVNLAARLEQMNKTYGTRLLVAESTVSELGPDHPLEPVGELDVRGMSEPVRVYTLKPHEPQGG